MERKIEGFILTAPSLPGYGLAVAEFLHQRPWLLSGSPSPTAAGFARFRDTLPPLGPSDLPEEMVPYHASHKVLDGLLMVSLSPTLAGNLCPKLSLTTPFKQAICVLLDP